MSNLLRTLLFLPIAFLAAIAAQMSLGFVAQFMFPQWIVYAIKGMAGSFTFLIVGFKIAPFVNQLIKWALLVLAGITGVLTIVKHLLENHPLGIIEGVFILLVAWLYTSDSPQKNTNEFN